MPAIGPTWSDKRVDEVTQKIIQFLKNEHHMIFIEKSDTKFENIRQDGLTLLRQAVEKFIQHDAYEGW